MLTTFKFNGHPHSDPKQPTPTPTNKKTIMQISALIVQGRRKTEQKVE